MHLLYKPGKMRRLHPRVGKVGGGTHTWSPEIYRPAWTLDTEAQVQLQQSSFSVLQQDAGSVSTSVLLVQSPQTVHVCNSFT